MLLTALQIVPGKRIVEHYGVVTSSTVRPKHVGRDFMAGLNNIVGGELKGYTELLQEAREGAQALGANAIVNIRLATSAVTAGVAELFAYGTAVKVE